jgi:phasin family protein
MTTLPTFDVPEAFKTAFADFQEKAKAAYEKSTASAADYSEFAKGNVEALVEAGKILTSGLQELGTALVADSREAFEALTGEVKSLAGAKTPTDFFQLQSDLLKKHFDKSVAFSSKQSEAVLKLASETVAPISGRVSLAVDKIKAAA